MYRRPISVVNNKKPNAMCVKYLIFRNLDNAIKATEDLDLAYYEVSKLRSDNGETAVVDLYDENEVKTHRFIVDPGLYAISAYQDQGD